MRWQIRRNNGQATATAPVINFVKTLGMITLKILGHPAMQLFSFCIILVGSAYFGGPYIFFLFHAVQEGYLYAIIGCAAIAITLASVFLRGKSSERLQFTGVALMVLSLLVFFFSSEHFMNMYVYRQIVPLLTLVLFITVAVVVTRKFLN
jgi:hypothetical protein